MDIALSGEQTLLAETVAAVAAQSRVATTRDLEVRSPEVAWNQLVELGLVGVHLPESVGGGGGTTTDLMVVVEELGRGVVKCPFLGPVLGADMLLRTGTEGEVLADVVAGRRRFPVALRPSLRSVARLGEPGAVVFDGAGSSGALVLDAVNRVWVVDVDAPIADRGADLTRICAPVRSAPSPLHPSPLGSPLTDEDLSAWEALALALLSADILGTMEGTLEAAVHYSRERVQFDVPIGSFQAIQHLCADCLVQVEGVRSVTWHAAWASGNLDPKSALLAARTAKAAACEAVAPVTEAAIQVHGGIAMTWETLPHVFLRRGLLSRATFGDEDVQYEMIARARLGGAC